eukprot:CAMPEP_0175143236 /NCGR_PEP_ID=MMETSP0087-20121206/13303_1 /TAXON_ID=136419 /ORGANISM="Unknown Unknown, Strain D1" /LENGTH=657 /DNA_ID=CAMNT_0016427249 /DNA_START=34 /DNA_END=2007 /DNA_ORIENTATION=-
MSTEPTANEAEAIPLTAVAGEAAGSTGAGNGDGDEDETKINVSALVEKQATEVYIPKTYPYNGYGEMIYGAPGRAIAYLKDSVAFYCNNKEKLYKEVISGMTVTILQVPESVAFSYVAGVDPISGLYSTAFLGFITAAIGGKPAMISGAAGAMAVVAKDLMDDKGPWKNLDKKTERFDNLLFTMFLCGGLQMLAGVFQMANLVRLIPQTAMLGFMNGLAIVIFMAQFNAFKYCPKSETFQDCLVDERKWISIESTETWLLLILVAITMIIMFGYPKLAFTCKGKRIEVGKMLPASLVSLIVCTVIEWVIYRENDFKTRTVKETAPIGGDLPVFHWPAPTFSKGDENYVGTMLSYAFSLAAVGLIESVMTLQALDGITQTSPSVFKCNQECFAQGIGNFVCSLFGAMGGDAMIGQSTINSLNGARGRVSGMVAGLGMFVAVVVASPVIEIIPIGALTGVLFMVVLHTFNWGTFRMVWNLRRTDAFGIVLVTVVAVWQNLAIGVGLGVLWSAVTLSWDQGIIKYRTYTQETKQGLTKVYVLQNKLFFGGIDSFRKIFKYPQDKKDGFTTVVLDLTDCPLADFTSACAINEVTQQFQKIDINVCYQGLSAKSTKRLAQTGFRAEEMTLTEGNLVLEGPNLPNLEKLEIFQVDQASEEKQD